MSTALKLNVPAQGQKITIANGKLVVPDQPIVPFIEGDGTGPDIWRASVRVMDAAVQKAYGGRRKIHWMEVFAGQKSNDLFRSVRGHRAIGVVYHPAYERLGNYVPTSLSRRYDAFIYLDETTALHPLHIEPEASLEPPETYPWNA